MRIQKTVTSKRISWLVTYDDKSSIQVRWLWGSWCAHFTGRGPRGALHSTCADDDTGRSALRIGCIPTRWRASPR